MYNKYLYAVLVAGFLIVMFLNKSTLTSLYYQYSTAPSFNCTSELEGLTWNEKCISEHTRVFWYCNGEEWNYEKMSCPFGYQCVDGHCKELPRESAIKIGDFRLSQYSAKPGQTIVETLLIYNMGTKVSDKILCTYALNKSEIYIIKHGLTSHMNCYTLVIEGGGDSRTFMLPVTVENDTNIVGYAIYNKNGSLYTFNYFEIQLNVVKPVVNVNWKPSSYSGKPGQYIDITYDINVQGKSTDMNIHACIIPEKLKGSGIIDDFSYYNEICDNYHGVLNVGHHTIVLKVKVPYYGLFDNKYGLGSLWYGYGDNYIIGTTYKYDSTTVKDWKYKFDVVNKTTIAQEYHNIITENSKYLYLLLIPLVLLVYKILKIKKVL